MISLSSIMGGSGA